MFPRELNLVRVNDGFILSAAPSRDQTRPSRDQVAARGTRHRHKQTGAWHPFDAWRVAYGERQLFDGWSALKMANPSLNFLMRF